MEEKGVMRTSLGVTSPFTKHLMLKFRVNDVTKEISTVIGYSPFQNLMTNVQTSITVLNPKYETHKGDPPIVVGPLKRRSTV